MRNVFLRFLTQVSYTREFFSRSLPFLLKGRVGDGISVSIPILNSFLCSQRKEAAEFLSSFDSSSFFVKRRRFRGGISNMFSRFLSWILSFLALFCLPPTSFHTLFTFSWVQSIFEVRECLKSSFLTYIFLTNA